MSVRYVMMTQLIVNDNIDRSKKHASGLRHEVRRVEQFCHPRRDLLQATSRLLDPSGLSLTAQKLNTLNTF